VKLDDLPKHIRETLAMQAILLQVGFEQDVLFVVLGRDGLGMAILKDGEHHVFPSALRPPDKSQSELVGEWSSACETWNASPQEDRHRLTEDSDVRKRAVPLLAQLSILGLMPTPKTDFPCPFCGEHVFACGASLSASHAAPPCKKFTELDLLSFLKQCRHAMIGN
jgi:hypothetical protein